MTDLNTLDLPVSQPQIDGEGDQDYDPSTSLGASINETMMMPPSTLAAGIADQQETLEPLGIAVDEAEKLWQKQAKAIDQKIRQNPYAYVAGAVALGLLVGRSLTNRGR